MNAVVSLGRCIIGKSQPKAPDPVATAQAQAAMNRDTAITQHQLNMVDQYNPWGSVTYNPDGMDSFVDSQGNTVETPRYTQTTTLTPEQQAIFDQSQAAQGNLAGLANDQSAAIRDLLNTEFTFNNDDAANWAYDLASSRIAPQQEQARSQLETRLANQGIRPGSAAWNAEMSRLTNANTDQMNQLMLQGRGQAFSEALAQRNQPINEITALLSGSQVSNPAQMSGATPQTSVGGVDYSGLVQQNYQNQLQAHQSKIGGIGGLFGSALGAAGQAGGFGALFSDRRLKRNASKIGTTPGGTNVYSYEYIWGGPVQIGVMADEVPHAVVKHPSGFDMVNYAEVR